MKTFLVRYGQMGAVLGLSKAGRSFLGVSSARSMGIISGPTIPAFVARKGSMFQVSPDTWIVSDTHFGHKNIVKYCNRPMHHNSLMIAQWHKRVADDDVVLHLGDLTIWYGDDAEEWLEKAGSLPGQKYMLRGNHDKWKPKVLEAHGWTVIPEFVQELEYKQNLKRVLFSHYPDVTRIGEWDVNIHGHIHNNELDPKLAATNRRYINVSIEVMDYKPTRLKDIL